MTIEELRKQIDAYNVGETFRGWVMEEHLMRYENEFLDVVRIDSSNHWVGVNKMSKMWSIIIRKKKDFYSLKHFQELQKFTISK